MKLCISNAAIITVLFWGGLGCATRHPAGVESGLLSDDDSGVPEILSSYEDKEKGGKLREKQSPLNVYAFRNDPAVRKWIAHFTGRGKLEFLSFLKRGERYRECIVDVLRSFNLPEILYYQALIESGFKVTAYSSAHAAGIWQFIPATAKRYGLRINAYVDERRDPMRSTIAASHFLSSLHKVFDSWPLALAAYNAGESRVMQTIMNKRSRDFWELARLKALPRETRDYIPKFIAAALVGENLRDYDLVLPKKPSRSYTCRSLVAVKFPPRVSLKALARQIRLPLKDVKRFNPHLKVAYTPPLYPQYRLWVPRQRASAISLKRLARVSHRQAKSTPAMFHRVRRGENLALIAKKYGVSVGKLRKWNGLRSSRIYPRARLRVSSPAQRAYVVRRGDSLSLLAEKFGTTVRSLKRLNKLRGSRIYAGQKLRVISRQG